MASARRRWRSGSRFAPAPAMLRLTHVLQHSEPNQWRAWDGMPQTSLAATQSHHLARCKRQQLMMRCCLTFLSWLQEGSAYEEIREEKDEESEEELEELPPPVEPCYLHPAHRAWNIIDALMLVPTSTLCLERVDSALRMLTRACACALVF